MQFTDSHLHLQDYNTNNALQIIAELRSMGFVKFVCVSSKPADWPQIAALATTYPEMIIPAFGLHPWYIDEAPTDWLKTLKEYLLKFPTAQVGECGLDRLKAPTEDGQKDIFIQQIELAEELNRPLNIHSLKADGWLTDFLPQMPDLFMVHSFGGSVEFLHTLLKAGAFISLSASILKRKNATEIIKAVPQSKLLLESDGPYLSSYTDIPLLAQKIAEIKEVKYEDLVSAVYHNFEEFNHGK